MLKLKTIGVILAALLFSHSAYADHLGNGQYAGSGWAFGGYIDFIQLDEEQSALEGIGKSALGFGIKGELLTSNNFTLNIGGAFISFDDDDEFTQFVDDGFGLDLEASDVQGFQLFADIGPQFYSRDGMLSISPRIGVSGFFGLERSISNCSDCFEEDVDLDSGVYIGVDLKADFNAFIGGISFSRYFDDGQEGSVKLIIQTHF